MAYSEGKSAHGDGFEAAKRNGEDIEGCDETFSSESKNEAIVNRRGANPEDTCGRNTDETVKSAMKQHSGSHGE